MATFWPPTLLLPPFSANSCFSFTSRSSLCYWWRPFDYWSSSANGVDWMCGTTRDHHHHTVAISNKVTIVGQRINKPVRKKNGRDVREERLTPRISNLSTRFKPCRHFVRLATSRLRDRRRCEPGTLAKRPKASDEVALAESGSGLSADWPPNQQKPETVSNGLEKVYNFISIPKILCAVLSLFSQVYALLGVRLRWTSIKMNYTFLAFHFILFAVSELVRARRGIHLDEHQVFSVSHKINLTHYLCFFETQYSKRYFLGKPFYCFLLVLYKK